MSLGTVKHPGGEGCDAGKRLRGQEAPELQRRTKADMRSQLGFWTGALLALGLSLGAPRAEAQEQRCLDLGANCVCSEPLNTNAMGFDGTLYFNPGDSNSKQCAGERNTGESMLGYNGSSFTAVAPTGLPAGINYVWETRRARSAQGSKVTDPAVRRVCHRAYVKYSSDYQWKDQGSGGTCDANKAAEVHYSGGPPGGSALHWDFAEGGDAWRLTIINFGGQAPYNTAHSGPISLDDCKGEWCRLEICESGEIKAGKNLSAEAYVTVVTGAKAGQQEVWAKRSIGDKAVGTTDYDTPWILNLYRQGQCAGVKQITHSMQAAWTSDSGQLIGAAQEVEGAGGGTSGGGGTSPPPSPPPPTGSTLGVPQRPEIVSPAP